MVVYELLLLLLAAAGASSASGGGGRASTPRAQWRMHEVLVIELPQAGVSGVTYVPPAEEASRAAHGPHAAHGGGMDDDGAGPGPALLLAQYNSGHVALYKLAFAASEASASPAPPRLQARLLQRLPLPGVTALALCSSPAAPVPAAAAAGAQGAAKAPPSMHAIIIIAAVYYANGSFAAESAVLSLQGGSGTAQPLRMLRRFSTQGAHAAACFHTPASSIEYGAPGQGGGNALRQARPGLLHWLLARARATYEPPAMAAAPHDEEPSVLSVAVANAQRDAAGAGSGHFSVDSLLMQLRLQARRDGQSATTSTAGTHGHARSAAESTGTGVDDGGGGSDSGAAKAAMQLPQLTIQQHVPTLGAHGAAAFSMHMGTYVVFANRGSGEACNAATRSFILRYNAHGDAAPASAARRGSFLGAFWPPPWWARVGGSTVSTSSRAWKVEGFVTGSCLTAVVPFTLARGAGKAERQYLLALGDRAANGSYVTDAVLWQLTWRPGLQR